MATCNVDLAPTNRVICRSEYTCDSTLQLNFELRTFIDYVLRNIDDISICLARELLISALGTLKKALDEARTKDASFNDELISLSLHYIAADILATRDDPSQLVEALERGRETVKKLVKELKR